MNRSALSEGAGLLFGFGLGTWLLGWWVVPVIALGWGLLMARNCRPWLGALAASIAWGTLLLIDVGSGAMGRLLERLSGVFQAPGWALIAATLAFPALLAWSGIRVGRAARNPGEYGVPGPK